MTQTPKAQTKKGLQLDGKVCISYKEYQELKQAKQQIALDFRKRLIEKLTNTSFSYNEKKEKVDVILRRFGNRTAQAIREVEAEIKKLEDKK